jgi:phosphomannomutase/phosphoglucomutase
MDRQAAAAPSAGPTASTAGGDRAGSTVVYWLAAYGGAAAVLLAVLSAAALLFGANERLLVQRQLKASSQLLADELSSRAASVRAQLGRWRSDGRLRDALLDGSRERLRAIEDALLSEIPGALGVVLLTIDDAAPSVGAAQRLSDAGVDMVRRVAETGQTAALQGHRVGQPDAHLAMAGPVLDAAGERPLGVVHVLLPLSMLPASGAVERDGARFQFRQRVGDALVAIGNGRLGEPSPRALSAETAVAGTQLTLSAWAEPRPLFAVALLPWLAGIYLLALLLLAIVFWLVSQRLKRAVATPAETAGLGTGDSGQSSVAPAVPVAGIAVPANIFRAYDIRGLVGDEIDTGVMRALGMAVGSEARALGNYSCVVARDQRPSSEYFGEALVEGLRSSGCAVIDLGLAPTPVLYFAAQRRGDCAAAMVTASHNPAAYNGLKVVLSGRSASPAQIQGLRERIQRGDFSRGLGAYQTESIVERYISEMVHDVVIGRPLKVVVDCGHATAALLAPRLYRALGCVVIELDCDLDPEQADRCMPDPSQPQNLRVLGDAVVGASADIGLAFDADGDRLGVADARGQFIAADRVLMLLAADALARRPGSDIVFDVKCSHHLGQEILRLGGRPVMCRSGHSFLKQQMHELDAPLAGELTGHIVFGERWSGFDDAFYAGARLLELLALDPRPSDELFAELPIAIATPELFLPLPTGAERPLMQALLDQADRLEGVRINRIDGLRVELDRGWGLVRASNTQPGLVFRFEGDDQAALDRIQSLIRRMMGLVAPELDLPF